MARDEYESRGRGSKQALITNYSVKRALGQAFRERLAEFEAEPQSPRHKAKMHSKL